KTNERFIKVGGTGARLYRTGDIGRLMGDGNIELLGRIDSQVKINGYRIELGEIERTLERHPRIRHAAACAIAGSAGSKSLVAYALADDHADPPSVAEVRQFLQRILPDYMVPSSIMFLSSL